MKKRIVFLWVIVLAVGLTGVAHADLIAYYPFNGNANDESGNGNDGTVNGATLTVDRFGNPDSAYAFDGSDDYIEVPPSSSLNITSELTITAWVNIEAAGGFYQHYVVDSRDGSGGGYGLNVDTNSSQFWIGNTYPNFPSTGSTIEVGSWHHVAGKYDGTDVVVYVDAIEIERIPFNYVIESSTGPLFIGQRYNFLERFGGRIDEVRIYNRALSETEIQELYEGQVLIDTMAPSGAVHAYPNLIWPQNKKEVKITLKGYVMDEMSIAREGGGHGVSSAYLLIDGTDKIILLDDTTNLLDENGYFSVDIKVKARKGTEYLIELFATDTNPDVPNGLVDSTHIRVSQK